MGGSLRTDDGKPATSVFRRRITVLISRKEGVWHLVPTLEAVSKAAQVWVAQNNTIEGFPLVRTLNNLMEDKGLFLRKDGSFMRANSNGQKFAQKKVAPTSNQVFEEEGRLWITLHAAQLRARGGK